MITRIMAALRIPPIQGTAAIWVSTVKRRLQVTLPGDAGTLDIEHIGRRAVAGGYPSLNASALVPVEQLGSGTPDNTVFLRGDGVWAAAGGGGGGDHATLSNLGWSASGHTGTANRVAGFDGGGAAAYMTGRDVCNFVLTTRGDMMYRDATEATRLPIGSANRLLMSDGTDPAWASPSDVRTALDLATYYQPLDAGLTSLTAADASAGLPYVSGANTWASATYSGMLSVVSGAWKVVGLRESGGQDLTMGAVADGEVLRRSGTSVVGAAIGSVLQAYNALLAAIAGLGSNGIVVCTSSSTAAARAIEGTGGIAVSNGDGASGNPSISLDASAKAVILWNPFFIVQPKGPTTPDIDGGGTIGGVQGVYNTGVSAASFRCVQFGDASTLLCRYYAQGYYQSQEGTWECYFLFQLGSDITTGTQTYYMGFSSVVAVNVADPSGHRAMLRYISGTDTTWKLSVKDGSTQNTVDTGVTVTASYYVAAKLIMTASSVTLYVSSSATVAGAKSGLAGASANTTSTNIPSSTVDLYWVQSVNRSAASTARGFKMAYVSATCTP